MGTNSPTTVNLAGIQKILKGTLGMFLDLLYPPLCRSCKSKIPEHDGRNFCDACWNRIEFIHEPTCFTCGYPLEDYQPEGKRCPYCPTGTIYFDRAEAVARYEGALRDAIHWLKYRYKMGLKESLGQLLQEGFREKYYSERLDGIIPVPLHWRRQRWREFNQAQLLSESLQNTTQIPFLSDALVRHSYTKPQIKIRSHRKRQQNIAGAFKVLHPEKVRGKSILLVDDLYTSGSTINECSKVLKEAGTKKVFVLTLARAGRESHLIPADF